MVHAYIKTQDLMIVCSLLKMVHGGMKMAHIDQNMICI